MSVGVWRGRVSGMKFFRRCAREHVLLRTFHLIVSDGWSENLFSRELETLYAQFLEGSGNRLPPLPAQYADFALWQRGPEAQAEFRRARDYRLRQLQDAPPELKLPKDRRRAARTTFAAPR